MTEKNNKKDISTYWADGDFRKLIKPLLHFAIPVSNSISVCLPTLCWDFVRLNVKIDEKDQIAGEKPTAKICWTFGSGTVSQNGEARVVCISHMRVRAKVDDE